VDYLDRLLEPELGELLDSLPAIAIEGPKGVGKTAMATRRARTIHALDDPEQFALARADPQRLLSADTPILIDEWQRLPETWDLVRRAVDAGVAPGGFSSPDPPLPTVSTGIRVPAGSHWFASVPSLSRSGWDSMEQSGSVSS
jgi:uncharacterized protein